MSITMASAVDSLLFFPARLIRFCLKATSSGWDKSNLPWTPRRCLEAIPGDAQILGCSGHVLVLY